MLALETVFEFNQKEPLLSNPLGEWPPRSTSSSSISSLDTVTPPELRSISLIAQDMSSSTSHAARGPPAVAPKHRRRRLPVFSVKHNGVAKKVSGYRLITAHGKMEYLVDRLTFVIKNMNTVQSPAYHLKTSGLKTPIHPPAVQKLPPPTDTDSHGRTILHPAKTIHEGNKTDSPRKLHKADSLILANRQPLDNPVRSLNLCLKQLSSQDWKEKEEGMLEVQALAQHHPDTLITRLYDICVAVTSEVKNLRAALACSAMETLAYLFIYLKTDMDPKVEHAGSAVLQRIPAASKLVQQYANKALEALVQSCSPGQVLKMLLDPGLSHKSAVVRASVSQQLHQLADVLESDGIFAEGKKFTETFVTAVRKMTLDAAAEVRPHGQAILRDLAVNKEFMRIWNSLTPEKDRHTLERIMRNNRMK